MRQRERETEQGEGNRAGRRMRHTERGKQSREKDETHTERGKQSREKG